MTAGLELQPGIGAVTTDAADDFAIAAELRLARRQHFNLPALTLGKTRIHAEQVAGKQRRLVAAGAGADFQQHAALVVGVLRQQQLLQFDFEFGQSGLGGGDFLFGKIAHFRVGAHRFGLGQVVLGLTESVELRDHRVKFGAFARQLAKLVHVASRARGRQHAVDFVETIDQQVQFLANARFHCV